jgi:hypothetical protein
LFTPGVNYRPLDADQGGSGHSPTAARFAEQLAASPRAPVDAADLDALRTFGWETTAEAIAGSIPART